MAVSGDLSTMPFPELLQWLGGNGKTGPLEVERDKICKRLVFQGGRIVSTSSNDPREMLGHFLVSRGQITEDLLRIALSQQEQSRRPLGVTLVDMGVLTSEELVRNLSAQAEETLFSLFEWEDAIFRFETRESMPSGPFPVDIRVEDILLRGMQRFDEVTRIRTVFHSPAIVPERTDKLPPPEVFRNRMARRIYEAVDGERTVADILLHAHGSEYVVTKFLFELHRTGLIAVREPAPAPSREMPVTAVAAARAVVPEVPPDPPHVEPTAASTGAPTGESVTASTVDEVEEVLELDPPPAAETSGAESYRTNVESELEQARAAMGRSEFLAALTILDRLYGEHPDNDALRRLTQEAEAAFVDKAWKHYLPGEKIAVLARPIEELEGEDLTPQEMFLLSRIDGTWTLKSIIQIAPIREVDALRTLKRMRDRGVIELRDPE